jgi:hypothetical protein
MRKYDYLFVVQGHYGFGWEDVTASLDNKEARGFLKDYRINAPGYSYRMIQRRELRVQQ